MADKGTHKRDHLRAVPTSRKAGADHGAPAKKLDHLAHGPHVAVPGHISRKDVPFECVALLLQGGGALGAYQAGVYEAMAESDLCPDWVAGISIGAINSAIIAGNHPTKRVEKLREFWEGVTAHPVMGWGLGEFMAPFVRGDTARQIYNQLSAVFALSAGAPGFFTPRMPPPYMQPDGTPEATSYYDTKDLKSTLERLIDFDRLGEEVRLSVGAVNVRMGNFVYFDSAEQKIRPEHIMASGALPPGFPAVEIEGEFYWDGGLVSNTPLQWVVQQADQRMDTLAFQVDLWNARGDMPRSLAEVSTRQKEIQYSSRTRAMTDLFKKQQHIRNALANLLEQIPDSLKDGKDAALLRRIGDRKVYSIVHLIYRANSYEGQSKDYEFSRLSMEEHWRAGYNDTVRTLRHREIFERPASDDGGVNTFDLSGEGMG
ncbi:MAG: patatin-like phospholipase family protein [Alphaproteobacteria bacterium]